MEGLRGLQALSLRRTFAKAQQKTIIFRCPGIPKGMRKKYFIHLLIGAPHLGKTVVRITAWLKLAIIVSPHI
jgi:hypothetical protein